MMIHSFRKKDKNIVVDVNSGAIHVVDDLVFDIINKKDLKKYTKEEVEEAKKEIEELKNSGLLFKEDVYKQHIKPRDLTLKAICMHMAHDCNLNCKYCFADKGRFGGGAGLMSFEVSKCAIDFVVSRSGNRRNIEIDFFGGEPLMNFEVIKQTVEYAKTIKNKNFRFTITTNGLLLSDEVIEYIKENMYNIVLSLDGRPDVNDLMRKTNTGEGSYNLVLDKFLKASQLGKLYYVRGTFTKHNLDFFNDVMHLKDAGFKNISIEPVVAPPDREYAITYEDLPKIFDEYDKLCERYLEEDFIFFHFMLDIKQGPCVYKRVAGCGSGHEYLAVTPEGDIYPCHQFVGQSEYKMGNVTNGSFDFNKAEEFSKINVYTKPKCSECWAKFYCSGGCMANSVNFNNNLYIPYDIECELEKKRLECAIYIAASKHSD